MTSRARYTRFHAWLGVVLFISVVVIALIVVRPKLQGITAFFRIGDWSDQRLSDSRAIGDKIIEAIGQYRRINGRYPVTLEALIPSYLTYIEPPTAGDQQWRYELFDNGGSFILSFAIHSGYPKCYYSSKVGAWGEDS